MAPLDTPLAWLRGEVRTPPFSAAARMQAGWLLRRVQRGETLSLPHSRALASIGPRCHELRISDRGQAWRIVYRIDQDAIVIVDVFQKKSRRTPGVVIAACRERLRRYDALGDS